MKFDFSKEFKNLVEPEEATGLTFAKGIAQLLFTFDPEKEEDKLKFYQLANRMIDKPKEVELDVEEQALVLKTCRSKMKPMFFGQVHELLNKK